MNATRSQVSVVGVTLLLGVGIVAIGLLTANVDRLVDAQIASTDADTTADGFSSFRDGVVAATNDSYPVRITGGDLSRVSRTIRITSEAKPARTYDADGYVAGLGGHWVAFVDDAVIRGTGDPIALVTPVPVAFTGDATFLTVLVLTADATDGGGLGSGAALRMQTMRAVTDYPTDGCTVAVETATPDAWERAFEHRGFNTTRTGFDNDSTRNVTATVPDERMFTVARYDAPVMIGRG